MKQLVIVGAGGLGRQALTQLVADYAHGTEWLVAGGERRTESVGAAFSAG